MPDTHCLPPLPPAWVGADGTHRVDTLGDVPVPERVGARAAAWRHLLDHDLHDVLANARRELLNARASGSRRAVAQALDRLDALLAGAAALADLPRAAEALSTLPADRVEPWPLLQSAWEEVRPLAALRGVQARFHAQGDPQALGAVYGSESWLRRMLIECLESAVYHCPEGGTVEISHCQSGPHAMIFLRDTLALSAASDTAAARLAEGIARLHGGWVREETDEGQRDLVIELPTGAPHQPRQATPDLAQAEAFAHEFSALRARAEQRGTARHDIAPGDPS